MLWFLLDSRFDQERHVPTWTSAVPEAKSSQCIRQSSLDARRASSPTMTLRTQHNSAFSPALEGRPTWSQEKGLSRKHGKAGSPDSHHAAWPSRESSRTSAYSPWRLGCHKTPEVTRAELRRTRPPAPATGASSAKRSPRPLAALAFASLRFASRQTRFRSRAFHGSARDVR